MNPNGLQYVKLQESVMEFQPSFCSSKSDAISDADAKSASESSGTIKHLLSFSCGSVGIVYTRDRAVQHHDSDDVNRDGYTENQPPHPKEMFSDQ